MRNTSDEKFQKVKLLIVIHMGNGNERYHFLPKISMIPTFSLIISMCDALWHDLMLSYDCLTN